MRKRSPRNRRRCANALGGASRSSRWSPTAATPAWTRSPNACVRTAICCRRRSIRNRFDAAFLREELDARVQDLGSPAAALIEPLLPTDPTLETLKLAEALAAGERAATLARRLVRPRRQRGPAGRADARGGLRSDRPAGARSTRSTRAFAQVARRTRQRSWSLTGPGAFSVEIGGRTAARGAVDRHGRHASA